MIVMGRIAILFFFQTHELKRIKSLQESIVDENRSMILMTQRWLERKKEGVNAGGG